MSSNGTERENERRRIVDYDDETLPDLDIDLNFENRQLIDAPESTSLSCWERFWRWCWARRWKIIPSFLVSNAFSCSGTVLIQCSLASVEDNDDRSVSFGLWGYSDPAHPRFNDSVVNAPFGLFRTCQYDFDQTSHYRSKLVEIVLDDTFRTARAFGVLAVCFGFLTMASMWLGVIRDYKSTTNWRRWVGSMLLVCCFFEGMTLLVFDSNVCGEVLVSKGIQYRDCRLAGGSSMVIAACLLWFTAGVMLLKWPRAKEPIDPYSRYGRERLAEDEAFEGLSPAPDVVQDERPGLLRGIWRSFRDEESFEMAPYNDDSGHKPKNVPVPDDSSPVQSSSCSASQPRPMLSTQKQQQSSLRSIFSTFEDEIYDDDELMIGNTQRRSSGNVSAPPPTPKQSTTTTTAAQPSEEPKKWDQKLKQEEELERQMAQWMPPNSRIARPGIPERVRQQLSNPHPPTPQPAPQESDPGRSQTKQALPSRQFSLGSLRQSSVLSLSLHEEEVQPDSLPRDSFRSRRSMSKHSQPSSSSRPQPNLQALRQSSEERIVVPKPQQETKVLSLEDDQDDDEEDEEFSNPVRDGTLQDILSAFDD